MEKITLKALQLAGFQNAEMIAKIISYVPNPQVATEMLLGIYQPIKIDATKRFRRYKWDANKIVEITSIDELSNTITYKQYRQKTQTVYYLTKEDMNSKVYQLEKPKGDYYDTGNIPASGYIELVEMNTISDFENGFSVEITNEDVFELLSKWENWGKLEEEPAAAL